MMKKEQITLGLLFAVVLSCQARHTNEQIQIMQPHYDICVEREGIKDVSPKVADDGMMELVARGDEPSKKALRCLMLRLNLLDCQGTVKRKRFEDFYEDGHDVNTLPGVITGCIQNQAKGKTAVEKTYLYLKCFCEQKTFLI